MILNNELNLYKTKLIMKYYGDDSTTINRKMHFEIYRNTALSIVCFQSFILTRDPIFLFLGSGLLGENILLNSSHLEKYSLDYIKLRKSYSYIIEEYNKKINTVFGFKHPVNISETFVFAYRNGYLSKRHKFRYSSDVNELFENIDCFGATVFTGNGCCRHMAPLLNDVFKDLGFDSTNLLIGLNTKITNSDNKEVWKYDRNNVRTNHAIVGVLYGDEAYYIDPTNEIFYDIDNITGRLIDLNKTCEGTIDSGECDETLIKNKLISHKVACFDTIKSISNETIKTCKNNEDIFEQFYRENCDVYKDISNNNLIKSYRKVLKK